MNAPETAYGLLWAMSDPERISDLATPCFLVDRVRLSRNLEAMQQKADQNSVRLRPHTKTHKSVSLAREQLDLGARGITVAKVGEAEVYSEAGFDDIRIAYILVGDDKFAHVAKLHEKSRISFCVDTLEGARAASGYFADRDLTAEVLIEIDCGYGRCGVPWDREDSILFVRAVSEMPGLSICGILTHAGDAYNGPSSAEQTQEEALRDASERERDRMISFAGKLAAAGIIHADSGFEISIGSTPSMRYFENAWNDGFSITEIRPGNYVFNDCIQLGLKVADWSECALTVLTTVISKRRDPNGTERLFLDAGKKVFTSDIAPGMEGYGAILYNSRTMEPLPHAVISSLSEEHGWVRVPGGSTLSVGDRIRVIPNHACVALNTQHVFFVVEGDEIVDTWHVDARGRVA